MKWIIKIALIFLLVYIPSHLFAQNESPLTINQIMQGNDFVGYLPENIVWSGNGKDIYFSWNPEFETLTSLYKISLRDINPQKVSIEEQKKMPSRSGYFNLDKTKKVYSKDGDIFLLDIKNGNTEQITNTVSYESNPIFTSNEQNIVYRSDNNLFSWSMKNGNIVQLTNFVPKKAKDNKKKSSEQDQWIEDDEMSLMTVLNDRKLKEEKEKLRKEKLEPSRALEISLDGQYLSSLIISPDQSYVVYQIAKRGDGKNAEVPSYINESGYTRMMRARSNVGSPFTTYTLGIYDIKNDTTYSVDTKQIEGIYDKPEFLKDYSHPDSTFNKAYKKPREIMFQNIVFNQSGNRVALVVRSLDNKDRWIMHLNPGDGTLELLDRQSDEAWIGGPGIGEWNYEIGNFGWISDESIWYHSEESGFSHIYTTNTRTKVKNAVTSGEWEVYKADLSNDKKYFYLITNKERPAERHFYRVPVSGGDPLKYTVDPGNYEVSISPDEKMLALRFSQSNKPWELYLMPNKPGAKMQQITHSTTNDFNTYTWRQPEIINFPAEDGENVHARLYRPDKPQPNGPAVVFVHGAGYLQNAHLWWSSYFREYMFHNFLVDQGYTVLDIDYRGSEGYGRDWRTGVYRHMGGKDLTDHVDGVKYLVEKYSVDPQRVGLYGGSYGGFITIFAMFKHADIFQCGAALRSVTDWAHYNHAYTSNRLNTPVEDSVSYKNSSPIYYAEGFDGELVMLHGMVDTNVHFQDVVRLSQRLIELGKDDWDVAIYPVESHGFVEPSSWADEYRRIYELFERNLMDR